MTPKAHRFLYLSQSEALQSTRSFSASSQTVDPGPRTPPRSCRFCVCLLCGGIFPADCPLMFAPALLPFLHPSFFGILFPFEQQYLSAPRFQRPLYTCWSWVCVLNVCACHCWTDVEDTLNNCFKWFLWPENAFCANMIVFVGCCRTCSGFIFE